MVKGLSRALVATILLGGGCTSIDYRAGPVSGLENLAIDERHVDRSEIYARCSSCGNFGLLVATACTCINFRTRRAVIWLAHDASPETIEHERAHARGYDHIGGELRRQYAAWAQSRGTGVPATPVFHAAGADPSSPAN